MEGAAMALTVFEFCEKRIVVKNLRQDSNYFELELNKKIIKIRVLRFIEDQNLVIFQINGRPYKACILKSTASEQAAVYILNLEASVLLNLVECVGRKCHDYSDKLLNFKIGYKNDNVKFVPAEKLAIHSPLAGKITKILVKSGQFVSQNQAILSIESMKMENEIRMPFPVFIKNILISEGNLVKQNQLLITFEKKGEGDAGEFSGQKVLQGG